MAASSRPDYSSTACASALTREAGRPVTVIPAYKPSSSLPPLVAELAASAVVDAIIVVNDGSGPDYDPVFAALNQLEKVRVLRHVVNLGKGAALKTGLNYAACHFPHSVGVVTADADGQHKSKDILRTAEALSARPDRVVLGSRQFGGEVPLRSKFGNIVTRYVMRAVTGQKISDTQSGLRGIPTGFIPDLMRLRPNGYDFELEMLLACKRTMRAIQEIPIETVYEDGNRCSHFNPLLDSMRIYFVFLRFAAASLTTAGLDNLVFIIAFHFWPYVLLCQACSRLAAGLFNYYINKTGVFHSRVRDQLALPKYWGSVVVMGAITYGLINFLVRWTGMPVIPAKICVESTLFVFSFVIQRDFIFVARSEKGSTVAGAAPAA